MNHSFARRRGSRLLYVYLGGLLGLVIIIGLIAYFGMPRFIAGSGLWIAKPFWNIGERVSNRFREIGINFHTKQSLMEENAALTAQVAALESLALENSVLKNDLSNISHLIDSTTTKLDTHIVQVYARPPVSAYGTLVIGYGTRDGARVGARIFSEQNALVGEISDVFATTSKVVLYSAPGVTHTAELQNPTIGVILTGRGGGNFVMELPRDTVVTEGAPLIVPGDPTLVIGVVGKIISDSRDPLEQVLVSAPVNVFELSWVMVEN